jgi:2'-5' RNA ligase
MRLFIGIPLASAVVDQLSSLSLRLRSNDDGLRWSTPESWHITLQFLGSTSAEQYACIVSRLRELRFSPMSISLGSLGFFERAGVFFTEVELTPELTSLQRSVLAATSQCEFTPEDRQYHPHITLARTKGRHGKPALRKLKDQIRVQPRFAGFTTDEFLLYESFLGPSGSRYEIRERFRADVP